MPKASKPDHEQLAAENAALKKRVDDLEQRVLQLEKVLEGTLEQLDKLVLDSLEQV